MQIGVGRGDDQPRSKDPILTGLMVCVLVIGLLLVSTCIASYWQDLLRLSRLVKFIVNPPEPVEQLK